MELKVSYPCIVHTDQLCPCQHDIEIWNFKGRWNAIKICQYYIDNSWPIPSHFKEWSNFCEEKCANVREKYSQYYLGTREKYYAHFGPGYLYNIPKHILDDPSIEIVYLE